MKKVPSLLALGLLAASPQETLSKEPLKCVESAEEVEELLKDKPWTYYPKAVKVLTAALNNDDAAELEKRAVPVCINWEEIGERTKRNIQATGVNLDDHYWVFRGTKFEGLQASSGENSIVTVTHKADEFTLEHEISEAAWAQWAQRQKTNNSLDSDQILEKRRLLEVIGDCDIINGNNPEATRKTIIRIVRSMDDKNLSFYFYSHRAMKRAITEMPRHDLSSITRSLSGPILLRGEKWSEFEALVKDSYLIERDIVIDKLSQLSDKEVSSELF